MPRERQNDLRGRAYQYALDIFRFLEYWDWKDPIVQVVGRQLLRSATSIGGNIIEAQGASSRRDFTNSFHYSLKSANESAHWIALLRDAGKAGAAEAHPRLRETREIVNILASSLLTLKARPIAHASR